MATLTIYALLTGLFARVSGLGIQFINPPTHGTDGGLSNPPTYKQDYTINIQWYPGDERGPYDLVLHQVKTLGQDQTGDGEFIMPSIWNTTSYLWLVKTNASLTDSTLFFLSVFSHDGDSDTSQYFNIVDDGGAKSGPDSSSVVASSLPTASVSSSEGASITASASASTSASRGVSGTSVESGTDSASTPTSPTANTPTSTVADPSNPHDQKVHQHMHNDFQLSHKIGLRIGIPATLALGIAAGWLLFRRLQKKRRVSHELPATKSVQHEPDRDGHHADGDVYEAPSNHILEIGRPHGQDHEHLACELEDKPAIVPEALPLRYEMEANTAHELHDQPVKPDEPIIKTEN